MIRSTAGILLVLIFLTVVSQAQTVGTGEVADRWKMALALHPTATQAFFFDSTVTAIPPEIKRLTSLMQVRFIHSPITDLPEEFYSLPLKYVEFYGTTQLDMSEVLLKLKRCRNLIQVTFSELDSFVVPATIGELTQLQSLAIWNTRVVTLPETIGNLKRLENLSLAATGIDSLPITVRNLTSLKMVSLEYSGQQDIPVNFLEIPNLTDILLDNNPQMDMDHVLSQLLVYKMEVVSMRDCNLIRLPEAISSMKTLKNLVMDSNHLTSLPAFITELPEIEWLWVKNNRLEYLPFDIGSLTKLKYLEVSSNNLTELPLSLNPLKDQLVNIIAGNNMFSTTEKDRIRKIFSKVYLEL